MPDGGRPESGPGPALMLPVSREAGGRLTPRQIAEAYGVSWSTVYREIRRGRLAARRIGVGRGVLRIEPAEALRYWNDAAVAAATGFAEAAA